MHIPECVDTVFELLLLQIKQRVEGFYENREGWEALPGYLKLDGCPAAG